MTPKMSAALTNTNIWRQFAVITAPIRTRVRVVSLPLQLGVYEIIPHPTLRRGLFSTFY